MAFFGIILKGNTRKSKQITSPQVLLIPQFHIKTTAKFHLSTVTTLAFLSGSVRAGKRLGFTMKSPLLNRKLQNMCKETSLGKIPWMGKFYLSPSCDSCDHVGPPKKGPDLGVSKLGGETRSTWHSY